MEEIELKFLEVDVENLITKLDKLEARKVGEYFYKRIIWDFPDHRLQKSGGFLRLRDEGENVTMTFKSQKDFVSYEATTKDVVMIEDEVIVSNFENTRTILRNLGMIELRYQENKRIRYTLGNVEIDIDFWPRIPPYVEIEGPSIEEVLNVVEVLGFNKDDAVRYSAGTIYDRHYGIKMHEYSKFTFDECEKSENPHVYK